MGLLTPLVHKCDEGVQAALDSQAALSQQIDRVTTCLSPAHAAHSYAPYRPLPQLHPTSNCRPPPSPSPHRPTASLRRSQPSCRRFSVRRRSHPSHRTRRSCRVCAGESLRRMARCSRYRLDSHGSTAWRSGSKQGSTTRCGRFLCRSRQVRMPGPLVGQQRQWHVDVPAHNSQAPQAVHQSCVVRMLFQSMSMWYITARAFGHAHTHTTQRRDREGARASCMCLGTAATAAASARTQEPHRQRSACVTV